MKHPWFKFYSRDWMDDMELSECSLDARGALVGLMCLSREGTPSGYLGSERGPFSENRMASRISCTVEELHDCIEELKAHGRLLENEAGILYIPRMVADAEVLDGRINRGKMGGRPKNQEVSKTKNQEVNQEVLKNENQEPNLPLISDSDSDSDSVSNTENTGNTEIASKPRTLAEQKAWLDAKGWSGIRKASPELIQEISDLKVPDMEESDDLKSLFWIQGRIWWFEDFWGIYWLKKSKHEALVAYFEKVTTLETHDRVIAAVEKQTPEMMRREPKNRPHGATWINGFRWNDEAEDAPDLFKGVA